MIQRIIVSWLLLFTIIYSQENVRISEILDANLIKLTDGRIIKLAGVDAPSCSSSVGYFRRNGDEAKLFWANYYNSPLQMDSIAGKSSEKFKLVFLYRRYFTSKSCLNEKFLYDGFGKYIKNFQIQDSTNLLRGENYARKNELGVWRFFSPTSLDSLDATLTASASATYPIADSTKFGNAYPNRSIFLMVPYEVFCGTIITTLSMIAGIAIDLSLSSKKGIYPGLGGALIGFSAGYLIGFPWVIYGIASADNPNLNLWVNFGCSWGLTLATGTIAFLVNEGNHPINTIAALSPIIGSLLYVHLLAPQKPMKDYSFLKPDVSIKTFKDFREISTTRMEFFRINF